MQSEVDLLRGFLDSVPFASATWTDVPDSPGVYAIYDRDELVYVGMAGRDGKGSLRKRLRDHSTGQMVNMFAQYLFLARVQFLCEPRATHPSAAKAACQKYIRERCSFRVCALPSAAEARAIETRLRRELRPALNGTASGSDA